MRDAGVIAPIEIMTPMTSVDIEMILVKIEKDMC
jgi:hypothetical protein